MRLLVTNTHTPQAYAIIRALRPHATRVVATIEGDGLLAGLAHAARSRLVDARHRVPSPVEDWSSSRVASEVSRKEEAYVRAVLAICEREGVDVVFPSWDPYVAVLSRHRDRFAAQGITVPVPDFATVLTALDKHRTVEAARTVGFPCPRSYLYESQAQLRTIEAAEGFPLVVKPRFTSGGMGMAIVRTREELEAAALAITARHGPPLIQEYIPGGRRASVQLVLGKDGAVLFAFHKLRHRTFRRTARFGTVSESAAPDERLVRSAALVQKLGWWGAMGIETIRDPRDDQDKLMEVNPRFPRQLWNRTELGINEPLLCVRIARGETVRPLSPCPSGVWFVSPVEDLLLLALQLVDLLAYTFRSRLTGRPDLDAAAPPPSAAAQLRSFTSSYARGRRRVWDPYSRHLLDDPIASVLWWAQFSTWLAGSWRQVGR